MQNWEDVLAHYNITGKVAGIKEGPLVTTVEFLPTAGTKLKNVTALPMMRKIIIFITVTASFRLAYGLKNIPPMMPISLWKPE